MTGALDREAIVASLRGERTVDIVTTGRRSGRPRTTEIWTTVVAGRVHIAGTPDAEGSGGARQGRDWLANLRAEPAFVLRLKTSVAVDLPAVATPVTDTDERRRFFAAPEASWYVEQSSLDALVAGGPLAVVRFTGPAAWLEDALRRG
ncbi:MAG TPA: nitroreductase/quinone reductase family protein [Iamia sp.]